MTEFEIKDVIPRSGVFDVQIRNENGEFEEFTFDNEMIEDKKYIEEISQRIENRNCECRDKKEFENEIGSNVKVENHT